MDFSEALKLLKEGKVVARLGWNAHHSLELTKADDNYNRLPYITMIVGYDAKDLQTKLVPWVCSHTDMLAEDWAEVNG